MKVKVLVLLAALMLMLALASPAFASPFNSCKAILASEGKAPSCPGIFKPGGPE